MKDTGDYILDQINTLIKYIGAKMTFQNIKDTNMLD